MSRPRRCSMLATLAAAVLVAGDVGAQVASSAVDLYTMGAGDDVFSRYGHAALCVHDAEAPEGRCYNYGTTDFSTPVPLTWSVLRGRARFWVSVSSLERMVRWYGPEGEDRTVWRQRIPLDPSALEALESRLRVDLQPGNREYTYHHFRDNCTTRIRDHIDVVTGGSLRAGTARPHGATWRALVLRGLAGSPGLALAGELLLGRPLEAEVTRWEAMFLPAVLRSEVQRALGARPVAVHTRRSPEPAGSPYSGRAAMLLVALALGCASVPRPSRRLARLVSGATLGLAGAVVWGLSLASTLPELSDNDLRFVLVPSDIALGALRGRALTAYASARLLMALTASAASAIGLTPQPLTAASLAVVMAMAPMVFQRAEGPRARAGDV